MNAHRFAAHRLATTSLLALTALATVAGCGASPDGEATGAGGSALSVLSPPADPNWAPGLSSDAIIVGHDNDGTPFYSCRVSVGSSVQIGKTRKDWAGCDIGYGGGELTLTSYQTLWARKGPSEEREDSEERSPWRRRGTASNSQP